MFDYIRLTIRTAEAKPAASSSWLGRWFSRSSTPGPTKANLGEETAFYYDKELKRWVNKKVNIEIYQFVVSSFDPFDPI